MTPATDAVRALAPDIDPVRFEVIRNALARRSPTR